MLHRWGLAMVRLRWWVVAAWLVVFAASLLAAPGVTSALRSGFGEVDTESRVALKLMADRLGLRESSVTLVFSHDSLRATDAAFATSDILIVKALGFGTALAIFVDATIVRALLVPAIMRVLSGLNWWAPAFLGGAFNPRDDAKA